MLSPLCIVINLIDLIGSKDYAGPPSSYKSAQRFLNPGFGTRPRGSHTAGMKGIDAASRASEWKVAWLATDATAGSSANHGDKKGACIFREAPLLWASS